MEYKVLIVDDSAFMRKLISDVLKQHPQISQVETAFNGQAALRKLQEFDPDVITLDIEMPVMNGIEALEAILKIKKVPVIMCSSLTKAGAEITIKALEMGAFDFIQKPEYVSKDMKQLEKDIVDKVLEACVSGKKPKPLRIEPRIEPSIIKHFSSEKKDKLVIIGSSTGGPQALKEVIPYLPENLPAGILIVQHMPEKFTEMFAQRLDKMSKISVKEAKEGDFITKGRALLAPGSFHMLLKDKNTITLSKDPPVWGVRPAVDMTMASAAKIYQKEIVCAILTGMGRDGTQGVTVIRKYGGYCIAEDESTCVVFGMPKSVIEAHQADEIVPIHKVAESITKAVYS